MIMHGDIHLVTHVTVFDPIIDMHLASFIIICVLS